MLAFGTLIASVVGTTGAAMILIRPLIRANAARLHNVHVVVFFIFLVGNIGGALSPLGDPPLFIGFLQGVDFFWPAKHLWPQTALVAGCVLAVFVLVDLWFHRKDRRVTLVGETAGKLATGNERHRQPSAAGGHHRRGHHVGRVAARREHSRSTAPRWNCRTSRATPCWSSPRSSRCC